MSSLVVHYLRKDGTIGSEVIEASEGGGYTWKVPADFDGIIAGGGAAPGATIEVRGTCGAGAAGGFGGGE